MESKISLALFFTSSVSLQTWENCGMFEREVALYKRLQERGVQITFVSYGGKSDLIIGKKLPGFRLICNKYNWNDNHYINWLSSIWPWIGDRPNIIKSNQFFGSEVALSVSKRINSLFVARGGYIASVNMIKQEGVDSLLTKKAIQIEEEVLPLSDAIMITTYSMANKLICNNASLSEKMNIIPNYVLTDIFIPDNNEKIDNKYRLCFIGRLEKEKNILSLLKAMIGLDVELDIIGSGSLRNQLETYAREYNLKVNFFGNLPNSKLPGFIKKADIYIQPSLYEGHPKTILEAMSCGAAVIAGDSPGINDLINHRQNGFLCDTSPEGIRKAIQEVMADKPLRYRMGTSARNFIVQNYSLDKIVEMELDLYYQLLANKRG